jgi:class 3 adenylate cyclase/tetratricopeptide (TPR) repeat protein
MAVCTRCGQRNPAGARFCNACAAPLDTPDVVREQRKTVTVVFSDVSGSTALGERLDPESLRHVLARYFDVARDAMERHGGVVEKFIGDAVMAVFGIPQAHEDDALRAVRAATDLRLGVAALNEELEHDFGTRLALRIGVNTGEVVTGTEERLATGDAVNVAARLEQAAQPDDILIGPETLQLVAGAVSVEPHAPLELKGKIQPFAAYRLVSVRAAPGGAPRAAGAPMVGRGRQLKLLRDAFENVASEHSCHLFTVLGPAGVGKTRLVYEFLRTLDDVLVLHGRCLSYGEGITYWPVVEIVKQLGGAASLADETARHALQVMLGEVEPTAAATADQIAWAFRKLLEARATGEPVICLFDDIQWGENVFLELIEHVADLSRGAPILLLCMARPDLLDRRPTWAGGKLNATSVLLEPLSEPETDELISSLLAGSALDAGLQLRIRRAAGGNPLFVEEMLALARQANGGDISVPPSIHALLAARLDQLDPSERHVLERGSVEGEVFHRGAVAALGRGEPRLDHYLTALVRKDLLRPEQPQLAGEDGYRFRHLLIRDAAYEALPKATRAELHVLFASWLEQHGAALVELDEILGYHLEQAFRYRSELGPVSDEDRQSAGHAGELLARAGRRAHDRGDRAAAAILLERAERLLPEPSPQHVRALLARGRCLADTGDDWQGSRVVLQRAWDEAQALGREDLGLRAQLELSYLDTLTGAQVHPDAQEAQARAAISALERHDDEEGLARAWFVLATTTYWVRARWDDMREPLSRSIAYARRAGNRSMELEALVHDLAAVAFGSTPVDEGIRVARQVLEDVSDSRELQGWALRFIGTFLALEGCVAEGRELLEQARTIFTELGNGEALVALAFSMGPLELRAGDAVAAEREFRAALELAQRMGDQGRLTNLASGLADALLDQGRIDDAAEYVDLARSAAQSDDVSGQGAWRMAAARLQIQRGETEKAVRLAQDSISTMKDTNELLTLPDLLVRQAEVFRGADLNSDARGALLGAIDLFERKGSSAESRRARNLLEKMEAAEE